jgi:hypothetical protein
MQRMHDLDTELQKAGKLPVVGGKQQMCLASCVTT